MAVYLPTRPIVIPSALAGQTNGRLDSSILVSTPGQANGSTVILVGVAARGWRSLCADAKKHGHILKITGSASAYRTYAWQLKLFLERYVTYNTGSGVSVIWNGRRWWKRKGVPVTAKPGTSNHGWGLAVDTGEERDGDSTAEALDSPTLRWLIDNEHRHGFSHELQSEPWHIRYVAGDKIPAAVLAYEASLKPKPPATPTQETEMFFASAASNAYVWFFEPGRRTLVTSATDRARLAAAAGIPNIVAELSDDLFGNLADGRTAHQ